VKKWETDRSLEAEEDLRGHAAPPAGVATLEAKAGDVSWTLSLPISCPCCSSGYGMLLPDQRCSGLLYYPKMAKSISCDISQNGCLQWAVGRRNWAVCPQQCPLSSGLRESGKTYWVFSPLLFRPLVSITKKIEYF